MIDLGFVALQDKCDAYAAADVFVQPSIMESFSIVIMEAWLAGTPVLVHSGCAVTRAHVEASGGGLHFNDYPHFAECLDRLLASSELRKRLAAAGREYVLANYAEVVNENGGVPNDWRDILWEYLRPFYDPQNDRFFRSMMQPLKEMDLLLERSELDEARFTKYKLCIKIRQVKHASIFMNYVTFSVVRGFIFVYNYLDNN